MELYQREMVGLVRASGARLAILHDHDLIDLWRRYSQNLYFRGWVDADRLEVYRFVTWGNGSAVISRMVVAAQREREREARRQRRQSQSW